MTPWMPDAVTSALDPDGRLTDASVEWLIKESIESDQLDYKAVVSPPTQRDRDVRFASEVAAFANHRGGLLLYGVKEQAGKPVSAPGVDIPDVDNCERMMRGWLSNTTTPVPAIEFTTVKSSTGAVYLGVSVPPSAGAPHAVRVAKSPLSFKWPVRDGTGTRFLTEPEIADRYAQRFVGATQRRERADEVEASGLAGLGLQDRHRTTEGWVYLSVTPERPADPRLNQALLNDARAWLTTANPTTVGRPTSIDYLSHRAAPGRVQMTVPSHKSGRFEQPRDLWIELYRDGSAFVAVALASRSEQQMKMLVPVGIPVELIVAELIFATGVALPWVIHRVGAWGTAAVRFGLAGADARKVSRHTLQLPRLEQDSCERIAGSDVAAGEVEVSLPGSTSPSGRMTVVHEIASELLQHYALPENPLTTAGGELRIDVWPREEAPHVQVWASEQGVLAVGATGGNE